MLARIFDQKMKSIKNDGALTNPMEICLHPDCDSAGQTNSKSENRRNSNTKEIPSLNAMSISQFVSREQWFIKP